MQRASISALGRVVGASRRRCRVGRVRARPPVWRRWTGTIPSNGAGRATAACCVQQVVAVRAAAGAPRKHPHPYWPGGAVLIEPGADRRAIGLIDDLAEDLLH